jgi:hypothetical protein
MPLTVVAVADDRSLDMSTRLDLAGVTPNGPGA